MLTTEAVTELKETVALISAKGKGILAADESTGTICKRFAAVDIPCNEETRRCYREMLLTTPNINQFISAVILYEETLNQRTNAGLPFAEFLKSQGIVPGIKVDKGLISLENKEDEKITQGLDGLKERLLEYKAKGARFAKWRVVFKISADTPTPLAIHTNAYVLAHYASICQSNGIVPIVEPEVLIDGDYTIERAAEVSESVLHGVFQELFLQHVRLEYAILKPSMVIAGKNCATAPSPEAVAKETWKIFRRAVPLAIPSINFLSGGQTPQQATANLNAINQIARGTAWNLSFSYARALQEYSMKIWHGEEKNRELAQKVFYIRAKLNSLAAQGLYEAKMEEEMPIIK